MSKVLYSANFTVQNRMVKTTLTLRQLIQDGVIILYSPTLEVLGSGYSQEQAFNSFNETCFEFFRYTIINKNLPLVLKDLGWQISK